MSGDQGTSSISEGAVSFRILLRILPHASGDGGARLASEMYQHGSGVRRGRCAVGGGIGECGRRLCVRSRKVKPREPHGSKAMLRCSGGSSVGDGLKAVCKHDGLQSHNVCRFLLLFSFRTLLPGSSWTLQIEKCNFFPGSLIAHLKKVAR